MKNNKHGNQSARRNFSDRGTAQTSKYKAVCTNCGSDCEVPFKPTGNKPVYCDDCFSSQNKQNRNSSRSSGRDAGRRSFGDRSDTHRPNMHHAVCTSCGSDCEVPFRPTGNKPIYCDDCFKNNKNKTGNRQYQNDQFSAQFQVLNDKLDKILKVLSVGVLEKNISKKEVAKEKKATLPKKPTKKVSVKKSVTKKKK